eukprot:6175597-Pleurochrysis_carterae.AAC.1
MEEESRERRAGTKAGKGGKRAASQHYSAAPRGSDHDGRGTCTRDDTCFAFGEESHTWPRPPAAPVTSTGPWLGRTSPGPSCSSEKKSRVWLRLEEFMCVREGTEERDRDVKRRAVGSEWGQREGGEDRPPAARHTALASPGSRP